MRASAGALAIKAAFGSGECGGRDAWEKARQKSGRAAWFEETYKPIRTTACETTKEGTICGYVYFPCTEENGCRPVLQGTW